MSILTCVTTGIPRCQAKIQIFHPLFLIRTLFLLFSSPSFSLPPHFHLPLNQTTSQFSYIFLSILILHFITILITMPRCSGCRRDLEEGAFLRNRQGNLFKTCGQCQVSYPQYILSINIRKNCSNINFLKI